MLRRTKVTHRDPLFGLGAEYSPKPASHLSTRGTFGCSQSAVFGYDDLTRLKPQIAVSQGPKR